MESYPVIEFDPDESGLVEPLNPRGVFLPERCVLVYYRSLIDKMVETKQLVCLGELGSVLAPVKLYQLVFDNKEVCIVAVSGCGSPLAAAMMEELIVRGCRKFIACGSAGALNSNLPLNSIVIPCGAVRDEGTSYHYLPPSRIAEADHDVVSILRQVLGKNAVAYAIGLTWTTDAVYRETRNKIALRKAEGCLTVEMECSGFLAVSRFRGVRFGQLLLAGDDVSGTKWDGRRWHKQYDAWEKIFWLAVESAAEL